MHKCLILIPSSKILVNIYYVPGAKWATTTIQRTLTMDIVLFRPHDSSLRLVVDHSLPFSRLGQWSAENGGHTSQPL